MEFQKGWLSVTYSVTHVSLVDGKWHVSFGDTTIQNITYWEALPELPQGGAVV
jgi:hypothetical protein